MKVKAFHVVPLRMRLIIARMLRSVRLMVRIERIRHSRSNTSLFLVLNVPSHGNMGDQLIFHAIDRFLNDFYPNIRVEYFTTGELECGVRFLKRLVLIIDTIFITGGGFLGDIYESEEKRFHDVLKLFPNNRIILFPQTFFYKEDSRLLQEAVNLQQKCTRLVVATRESKSFHFINRHYTNAKVLLMPDVTTYLNCNSYSLPMRNGRICICSRDDKEKTKLSSDFFKQVIKWADDNNVQIDYIDTQVPYAVKSQMRNKEIKKMFTAFASFELVITDRLHGMLYSIISGTPVIAIDNCTNKISGAYNDWFVNIPYVCLCNDEDDIIEKIESLYKIGGQYYDNSPFIEELKKLISYVDA